MIWLVAAIVSALGGFVQAFTGFGAAALLMTAMPYAFTMLEAPAITQVICTALAATMAWRFRKSINLKLMLWPTVLYGLSSIAVIPLAKSWDLHLLTILFGGFLVVLSLYSLFFSKNAKVNDSTAALILCSVLSGILSGLFGVGGPTMALYLVAVSRSKEEYLGSLQLLFVVTNLVVTASRIANGILHLSMLPTCCVGIVFILLGKHFGYKVGDRLNADVTRKVVYIAVGVSGIITVLQQTVLR